MKAVLGLEDGTIWMGDGIGAPGETIGELVFATPYSGYEESLTDPSYRGQLLMFTYPLIGNYGVNPENFQSDEVHPRGVVVREACVEPSHHASRFSLQQFLEKNGVGGISGLDTRALTRKIRSHGTMRSALLVGDDDGARAVELARNAPKISQERLVEEVTCPAPYEVSGAGPRVVIADYGVKRAIIENLSRRGAHVVVVPANYGAKEVLAFEPDAVVLSPGPGDPKNAEWGIRLVRDMMGEVPLFGICLGHQLAALACGGDTYKLPFGHRGANQPVQNLATKEVYITSQNHGFAVDPGSLEGTGMEVTEKNLNDGTVEALSHETAPLEGIQYHPEASPGPHDTEPFFDRILEMAGGKRA